MTARMPLGATLAPQMPCSGPAATQAARHAADAWRVARFQATSKAGAKRAAFDHPARPLDHDARDIQAVAP